MYWDTLEHTKKLQVVSDILLTKNAQNLHKYKDFIKEVLKQNINNSIYIDYLAKSTNEEKFDLILESLNDLKLNDVRENKANHILFKIIDKSLLEKKDLVKYFLKVKEEKPNLIPSEILILYVYRAILVYKKEDSISMVKEVFDLAKRIGEDDWLNNKLYDFETEYNLGAKFTLGNNPVIKDRLMYHLYDFLQGSLTNVNIPKKKSKI